MSHVVNPDLPKHLGAYFTDRLLRQRKVSPHTMTAYRDTFRLLLRFAEQQLRKAPSALSVADLDAPIISAFLNDLEKRRGNVARTRNARLAAIHSFFRYVALQDPVHNEVAQRVLALPTKRAPRRSIDFLTDEEINALLAAPDITRWSGRRDRALLLTAIQTGLRVSELTELSVRDVVLTSGGYVSCHGKGRKDRNTPLGKTAVRVLKAWIRERGGGPEDPIFPNARDQRLTRDGVAYILDKHVKTARLRCPSLRRKHVSPHVLRHSTAMMLLQNGVDRSVIALWLGHESVETTDMYLHEDMKLKERALARTSPPKVGRARYRPSDRLLEFLESL